MCSVNWFLISVLVYVQRISMQNEQAVQTRGETYEKLNFARKQGRTSSGKNGWKKEILQTTIPES